MDDQHRTRRWERIQTDPAIDPLHALRASIVDIRNAPRDLEARRRLRAIAAEQGLWEELALLLADEARASAHRPTVMAAFYEELADVYENLDQLVEAIAAIEQVAELLPEEAGHHDRLAKLYLRAGAWAKAASAFERFAQVEPDERGATALRAAARLYRDNRRADHAAAVYRKLVERRPDDADAWRALDELLHELGQWEELAEVRGERAARARTGLEKAALLRAQARALEQVGQLAPAAELVARAARHAPDSISGVVDHADVLARSGRGREAAELLAVRIAEAAERGAGRDDVAALRLRLAGILEDACGDRAGAGAVLDELLAAAPRYLPALERAAARAAAGDAPAAHAAALLRYAEALPDTGDPRDAGERAAYVLAAARRYRDAGDLRAAVGAFERAAELAVGPDGDLARRELDAARTALAIERALAEAARGEIAAAERRLLVLLDAQPGDLDASLALAEVMAAAGRHDDAADHLRATLAAAPDGTPGERLAPVVHRLARVLAALGEADESHQLLHEAHRLDRRSLVITLALGESCFARRLWREAARTLGLLADHPDAASHAAAVAAALVHAAQAEVRALRPGNALAHYEAAARIDPACGPAWHAIAEAATERGDLAYAADCLEREATVTTAPRDRLRLWSALGDMAHDVLGDLARAERCWAHLVDDDRLDDHDHGRALAPVLAKLIAVQRKRGATRARGEACVRLAALTTDPRAQKELAEEAAEAFASGGDPARARVIADQLIARHPLDLDTVACATAIAAATGDAARVAQWLRRALAARGEPAHAGDDPRRADLWRRLGDAERALGDERAALAAYRRAIDASPESDGALGARRGLVELSGATGRAESSLVALVEVEQDPLDVLALARGFVRSGNADHARAGFELAAALGAPLSDDDVGFLDDHPARVMASDEAYAAPLTEAERRALVDDDGDEPLGGVLDLLGEVMPLVCPDAKTALARAGLAAATRIGATSHAAAPALYPQIAKALGGGPPTLFYATQDLDRPDLALVLAAPPVLVIGPRLASVRAGSRSDFDRSGDTQLRFRVGRVVELARPRRLFAAGAPADAFARLVAGLGYAFGGRATRAATPGEVVAEGERLRAKLPVALRQRLSERLAALAPGALDAAAYRAACDRAADRAGLIACGDVGIAIALVGGAAAAPHLVQLASQQRYLTARRKLRPLGRGEETTNPFGR